MSYNAVLAIQNLLSGKSIKHGDDTYTLSDKLEVCKLVSENGEMPALEASDLSLTNFLQMCQEIPRESLLLTSLSSF